MRIAVASAIAVTGLALPVAVAAPTAPMAPTAFSKAVELKPPPVDSNTGRDDGLTVVACPAAGTCSAGGAYLDWCCPTTTPPTSTPNSTASPAAGRVPGGYLNGKGNVAPLSFAETGGTWRRAVGLGLPKNASNVSQYGAAAGREEPGHLRIVLCVLRDVGPVRGDR